MNLRALAHSVACMLLLLATSLLARAGAQDAASEPVQAERPNILILTVDDMSCDSVGAFGCRLEGTTPAIDQLAERGLRYHFAHVQVGNCYPSRNVMFSGRYPHNTGVEGFYQVPDPDYAHLVDLLQGGGYFVGICGKVAHSTPYQPYGWDVDLSTVDDQRLDIKSADTYYGATRRGIELAGDAEQPFCLNINISDPHKPFYAMRGNGEVIEDANVPSRIYTPEEVPIPGFLFDHPNIRLELAHYYSSVRRADDCVAGVLRALDESGKRDSTVIMFLSDHGMPLPFAKTALWHHSTRTPWIVCWPGVIEEGTVDSTHMISAVDMLPTLLDIAGIEHPEGFDGQSFMPTLLGEVQPERNMVFKVYNENSGGNRSPMRSVQSKRYGYIFNAWSDGERVFRTATTGTMSYRAMQEVASTDPVIAARLEHFMHNVPEEFYDYQSDPDALHNLIDDPDYEEQIEEHRAAMRRFMEESNDPVLEAFDNREDPQAVSDYVDRVQAESDERRSRRRQNQRPNAATQNRRLFQLDTPESVAPGGEVVVTVRHRLPEELGEQQFHVTLKDAENKRVERIVKSATGSGRLEVSFTLPADYQGDHVSIATFVGAEFASNLLHRTAGPIEVLR